MKHVKLRALEPEDLDLLYRIENDKELWDISTTNVPYSRFLLHEYISNATGDIYADGQVRLIIEDEDKTTIGVVDLTNFDARNNRAELGLIIEKPYRNQGYGMSVLNEISSYCCSVLHLHQLYVIIDEDNVASLSLFEKYGFQKTAKLPDWLFDGKNYRQAVMMQKILAL